MLQWKQCKQRVPEVCKKLIKPKNYRSKEVQYCQSATKYNNLGSAVASNDKFKCEHYFMKLETWAFRIEILTYSVCEIDPWGQSYKTFLACWIHFWCNLCQNELYRIDPWSKPVFYCFRLHIPWSCIWFISMLLLAPVCRMQWTTPRPLTLWLLFQFFLRLKERTIPQFIPSLKVIESRIQNKQHCAV